MYFLHDTHHSTVFSAFYLISWPKMEMKKCQLGSISYSATRSTSCRQFFESRFGCGEINCFNRQKIRQWWKLPVIGTPPGSLSSVSIYTSSSQVLNYQILLVVSLFDNSFAQEVNSPFKFPVHALFVFCQHNLTHMYDFMVAINCPC